MAIVPRYSGYSNYDFSLIKVVLGASLAPLRVEGAVIVRMFSLFARSHGRDAHATIAPFRVLAVVSHLLQGVALRLLSLAPPVYTETYTVL